MPPLAAFLRPSNQALTLSTTFLMLLMMPVTFAMAALKIPVIEDHRLEKNVLMPFQMALVVTLMLFQVLLIQSQTVVTAPMTYGPMNPQTAVMMPLTKLNTVLVAVLM